ncbi:MAG: hypothetical protein AABO41_25340 [Acidobacteriota bacterium]
MVRIEFRAKDLRLCYLVVLGIDLFFLAANLGIISIQSPGDILNRQLDLKLESNLATWYSSVQLFAAGMIAIVNARHNAFVSKLRFLYSGGWLFIAFIFVGISADEVCQVHEQIATLYESNRGPFSPPAQLGAGDWIPFLMPLIIGVPVVMILFFAVFAAHRKLSLAFAVAGLVCWIGSIYAESIEETSRQFGMSRQLEGAIEEGLEILGATLLLMSFVEFLISLKSASPTPPTATEPAADPEVEREGKASDSSPDSQV